MRLGPILLPISLCAAPAVAQTVAPAAPAEPKVIQIPPETADRLADSVQSLSQALLDMKVGGIQAALEGREPTRPERNLTVRDLGRRNDPAFDRKFRQQIAATRPQLEQSIKALNEVLPEITGDLQRARKSIERAMANTPDPNYPKR
jgi:hypothetical protein